MEKYKLVSVLSIIILMFIGGCDKLFEDKKQGKEVEGGGTTECDYPELTTNNLPKLKWVLEGKMSDYQSYSSNKYFKFGVDWLSDTQYLCNSKKKRHNGWDIHKPNFAEIKGKKVYAAYSGVVKTVYNAGSGFAQGMTIEHTDMVGDVFTTNYTHIDPVSNMQGKYVEAGQHIAYVADLAANDHLHFSLRRAPYSNFSNRGALPRRINLECNCTDAAGRNDPVFPEYFVNPGNLIFEDREIVNATTINIIGTITAVSYPTSQGNNKLEQGKEKNISFKIKNISNNEVTRSFKLYLVKGTSKNVIWEKENVKISSNQTISYSRMTDISLGGVVASPTGNYQLVLEGGQGTLSDITTNGSVVSCESSGCNPIDIQIISGTTNNTPTISVSLSSLSFGSVDVNQSTQQTFTIQNTGNATLTVNSITCPNGFSSDWVSGNITAGSSKTVTITFKPTNTGSYSGNIIISSNASNGSKTVSVSGTGLPNGPTFNPSVTSCSGSNITCGGHIFYSGTIYAEVVSFNSSTFTIRVRKCSGSFANSGTAYVNIGTTCSNAVNTKSYSAGVSYIDIPVTLRSGTTTYWITVSSATTDYFHAGTIAVTN